jgi:hypothetical protein
MLIGLPGIGKTKWAEEYSKSNPEKQFSIVGISSILEKMKASILNLCLIY